MGAVLAKFRKEKSSADVLEKLETEIRTIEKFSVSTQAKQKRLVGNFLVISIGLYTVGFLIFYFVFFPPTWAERITYSIPLLIFPLLIFLLRRLLAWYFQRKINKNSTKLVTLRAEKKRILEEVMEKETYNVASKLLSKYGDKSYGIKALTVTAPTPLPNRQLPENRIQNTSLIAPQQQQQQQRLTQMAPNRSVFTANNGQSMNSPNTPRTSYNPNTSGVLRHRITQNNQFAITPAVKRPFPIINQKTQGMLDKMVDYLIGDGPQNRYALICKECFAHNGMAREEEFDYTTFRCAFCNALNPSRKLRPVAPKLSTTIGSPSINALSSANSDSDTQSESDDDSDSPRQGEKSTLLPTEESETVVEPEKVSESKEEDLNKDASAESESKPSSEAPSEEQKSDDKDEAMQEKKDEHPSAKESEIVYNNLF